MKRKIAAVLMADIAPADPALPGAGDAQRKAVRNALDRGGGALLPVANHPAVLAEFQSAVQAVRTAVDMQESLRSLNKAIPEAERAPVRIGIAIAEVNDGADANGEVDIPEETLAEVTRLVGFAVPGGVSISRSVREAVLSKLKLRFPDWNVDGHDIEPEPPTVGRPVARKRTRFAGGRTAHLPTVTLRPALAAAVVFLALAVGAYALLPGPSPEPQPAPNAEQQAAAPTTVRPATPPPPASEALPASIEEPRAPGGGRIEFKPAHAPDPAAVLTARRMLPNAWRDCHAPNAETALSGCKLLIDSGIAKGEELADILTANGRALRDSRALDKAIESLTEALAIQKTPAAYTLRGTVRYEQQRWDEAIADFSEAIKLDAANGEAFNNRAWTYYRSGRASEALPDADMAVRLLAKEAYVWDTRAHIHAELGNRDAAIRDFRAALAIDPADEESKAGLARLGAN